MRENTRSINCSGTVASTCQKKKLVSLVGESVKLKLRLHTFKIPSPNVILMMNYTHSSMSHHFATDKPYVSAVNLCYIC